MLGTPCDRPVWLRPPVITICRLCSVRCCLALISCPSLAIPHPRLYLLFALLYSVLCSTDLFYHYYCWMKQSLMNKLFHTIQWNCHVANIEHVLSLYTNCMIMQRLSKIPLRKFHNIIIFKHQNWWILSVYFLVSLKKWHGSAFFFFFFCMFADFDERSWQSQILLTMQQTAIVTTVKLN